MADATTTADIAAPEAAADPPVRVLDIVYRCRTFGQFPKFAALDVYPAHGWRVAAVEKNREDNYFVVFEGTSASREFPGAFDEGR